MSSVQPVKIHYQNHMELTVDDFRREQKYHLNAVERHNRTCHRWGIISGLDVKLFGENIIVTPGEAIDANGRHMSLVNKRNVITKSALEATLARNLQAGQPYLAVWLRYKETAAGNHWQEDVEILYEGREARISDGRAVIDSLRSNNNGFADILLGQVFQDGPAPEETVSSLEASQPRAPIFDNSARPVAGIRANSVVSLDGNVEVSLNDEDGKFSVGFLAGRDKLASDDTVEHIESRETEHETQVAASTNSHFEPVLELDGLNGNKINGDFSISGQLSARGGLLFDKVGLSPAAPSGWAIYRAKNEEDNVEELRIEMPTEQASLVIGAVAAGEQSDAPNPTFKPGFRINSSGDAFIPGNLTVAGKINPGASLAAAIVQTGGVGEVAAAAAKNAVKATAEKKAEDRRKTLLKWTSGLTAIGMVVMAEVGISKGTVSDLLGGASTQLEKIWDSVTKGKSDAVEVVKTKEAKD